MKYLSPLLLIASCLLLFLQEGNKLWQMGFFISVASAFVILWLTLNEKAEHARKQNQEKEQQLNQSLKELQVQLIHQQTALTEVSAKAKRADMLQQTIQKLQEELARLGDTQLDFTSDPLNLQLRAQLEEKTKSLNQARIELFQLEGKYIVLQKEFEHALLETHQTEAQLIEHLKESEADCQDLEAQLAFLLSKKRTKKAIKATVVL